MKAMSYFGFADSQDETGICGEAGFQLFLCMDDGMVALENQDVFVLVKNIQVV